MENIGTKRIYLWGSRITIERAVRKDEATGTYWATWGRQQVEVKQTDGLDALTSGWITVDAY